MKTQPLFKMKYVRVTLLITILLAVLGTVTMIVQMTFLARIINQIFLMHQDLAQVTQLLGSLLMAIFVHAVLVWLREINAQRGAIRVKTALRVQLFTHLAALGPAYLKSERTGELVTTAGEGIERLDAYVSRYLPQIYLSILIPFIIGIYIFPLDWISSVLLLITCPIIPLLMIMVGSYAEEHMQRQWTSLSRMSAHFLDAVQGLSTLKLFGRSHAESERVAKASDEIKNKTLKVLRYAFLSGGILEFMTTIAIGLVAVTLGIRLLDGGLSFLNAFVILLLAPEFYRPLRDLGVHRHTAMEGKAATQRINEILQTPLPVNTQAANVITPERELTVQLIDVTYRYPQSEHPALKGINLTLPAGSCTVLVGRSGAGKSTLLNLLMRFHDTELGTITRNDTSIMTIGIEQWREQVALVPQRPYLFYGTVSSNIRLAHPNASDEAVQKASELAGADEFIQRLPQGYETIVSEQGKSLSAGQVQRIALARAFLKDAPFLLLDEPTAHLDPRSEALITQALQRLMQGRTVLVIAHRLNTIIHADQVAVLQDGLLVESGRPADLIQQAGPYAELMGAFRKDKLAV